MKTTISPETVLTGGILIDPASNTPVNARAQALAIACGRILAVGNNDDILCLAGPKTKKIDLGGRLVIPGFVDSHIHFYEWSLKRRDLQLNDVTSLEELLILVEQAAQQQPPGTWIMGQGWNETDWSVAQMPSRASLDRAAPNHPVLLWRCDLHLAVANSCALHCAGIDRSTDDPPDGRIEKDAANEPTGVLRELAINLVRRAVAPPQSQQILEALVDGAKELHSMGITGIHDVRLMADGDGARALQSFTNLDEQNQLELRTWVTLPGHKLDDIIGLGLRSGFGNETLRLGHVKFFSDGGMGARTAWMLDNYLDAENGMPLMDMDTLAHEIARADRAGLSVMVHAVGDRANREVINIFQDIQKIRQRRSASPPPMPHRIEHMQMVRPEDITRLNGLGLALCVTPCNMVLDINLIDTAVGENGRYTYAFKQLINSGTPVMFSSDCPVCKPAPLPTIHAAVTRQRPDSTPKHGWYPEARVSVIEALRAYTSTPAQVHRATDMGGIAPGQKADLAILSHDILADPPSRILETTVDMTIFNGSIVHRLF